MYVCSESAVVWGRDLGRLCRGFGLVGGIPEQLFKKNSWMERVTGVEVRRRCCGQPTIEEILRQRRMRWLGHVQRMGPERQPKAMYWGMREGKRKQGGQRKTWMQQARRDLEELRVTHDWMSKCQDRGAWVKLIKPTAGKKTKGRGEVPG